METKSLQEEISQLKHTIQQLESENLLLKEAKKPTETADLLKMITLIPGNLYWKNREGKFLGCNNNLAKILHLSSPQKIVDKTNYDLFDKKLADMTTQNDESVISSGQEQCLEEFGLDDQGNPAIYLTRKIPLRDEKKQIVGLLGVSFDITDRKRAEELIALIPGNLYWKDRHGKFLGCNYNVAKVLHLASPQEIVNKTNYDLFDKKLADMTTQIDESVMSSGQEQFVEEFGLDDQGNSSIYLTRKVPLRDEKKQIVGLLGISFDITDRKLSEEKEKMAIAEAVAAKTQMEAEIELRQAVMVLSGSMAHDLCTPIATIEGFVYGIQDRLADLKSPCSETTKTLKEIEQMSEFIQKTVCSMHEFRRGTLATLSQVVQKGTSSSKNYLRCSAWHCLHNALSRYPFSSDQHKLIQWDQKDFSFLGNEILMLRVITNLLKNALEQIQQQQRGAILIQTDMQGDMNLLRFKDTAGGISPDIIGSLFKGYQTTKEGGTGIGLAFCKLTMKQFGGDIVCHSQYGDYTEFVLTFPKLSSIENGVTA
jgi:signal transduction histidine kinase